MILKIWIRIAAIVMLIAVPLLALHYYQEQKGLQLVFDLNEKASLHGTYARIKKACSIGCGQC